MAGYPPDYTNSGFRYFSKPFNTQHAVQSFQLFWDPALVWYNGEKLNTGGWRPPMPADFAASVSVSSVAVTGGSINIANNVTVGNTVTTNSNITNAAPIAVSGVMVGDFNSTTTNQLLSGISGQLTSNVNAAAWVTGNVTTQTAGVSTVLAKGPSGTFPYTGMDSSYRVTGQVFGVNLARTMLFLQNVHTGLPLYVALNANAASTSNFSMILNPSTFEGRGGSSFADDHYRGAVCVSGGGWTAWEM
jgi:hypothetical protein